MCLRQGLRYSLKSDVLQLMRTLATDSTKMEVSGNSGGAMDTTATAEEGAAASSAAADSTAGTAGGSRVAYKAPTEASQGAEPFINLLAYNTVWMQRLWKRASIICQLPQEVQEESTLGNDIPTLQGGIAALDDSQRDTLHLFCELLSHALVVTGDESFHSGDEPLPLPSLRAVTISLNSLLFHSCMKPNEVTPGAAAPPAPARLDHAQQQLFTLAGRCLQQLHARHVRRPFAPESAWLAPWNVWSENNSVSPPSPPSVVADNILPFC